MCARMYEYDSRARLHILPNGNSRFVCVFYAVFSLVDTRTHTCIHIYASAQKTCNSCLNNFVLRCNLIRERNTITIHQDDDDGDDDQDAHKLNASHNVSCEWREHKNGGICKRRMHK